MISIIISLLSVAISGFLNAEMDVIKFKPKNAWFNNSWYLETRQQTNNKFIRTFGFMFLGGWHFIKGLRVGFFCVPVVLLILNYFHLSYWWFMPIEILLVILQGTFFEIGYNY